MKQSKIVCKKLLGLWPNCVRCKVVGDLSLLVVLAH